MNLTCEGLVASGRALVATIESRTRPGGQPLLQEVIAFAGHVVEVHERDHRAAFAGQRAGDGPARSAMEREHSELAAGLAELVAAVAAWEDVDVACSRDGWGAGRRRALAAARIVADDLAIHADHESRVVNKLSGQTISPA